MLRKSKGYCCVTMQRHLTNVCRQHGLACPDNQIRWYPKHSRYGIACPDGLSYLSISYCPWCGAKLAGPPPMADTAPVLGRRLERGPGRTPAGRAGLPAVGLKSWLSRAVLIGGPSALQYRTGGYWLTRRVTVLRPSTVQKRP